MTTSKNSVPIRLPVERWVHIVEEHPEMEGMRADVLETVRDPQRIVQGGAGELIAVRMVEENKWLVAVYRELDDDGFVITAFLTRRARWFQRRVQIWP